MTFQAFCCSSQLSPACSPVQRMSWRYAILLLCLFALAAVPARAQFDSGIRGVVSDPAGAVVTGAVVTLRSVNTGVEAKVTTGASGSYDLRSLAPGEYTLQVQASGFGIFSARPDAVHQPA